MTIDGTKIDDMSLDQIGAALQQIADNLEDRPQSSRAAWNSAVYRIACDVREQGIELRHLWSRHD